MAKIKKIVKSPKEDKIGKKLDEIICLLRNNQTAVRYIVERMGKMSLTFEEVQQKIANIDANTTAGALVLAEVRAVALQHKADLKAALEAAKQGNLSAEQEAVLFGQIDVIEGKTGEMKTNLEQTAHDLTTVDEPEVPSLPSEDE